MFPSFTVLLDVLPNIFGRFMDRNQVDGSKLPSIFAGFVDWSKFGKPSNIFDGLWESLFTVLPGVLGGCHPLFGKGFGILLLDVLPLVDEAGTKLGKIPRVGLLFWLFADVPLVGTLLFDSGFDSELSTGALLIAATRAKISTNTVNFILIYFFKIPIDYYKRHWQTDYFALDFFIYSTKLICIPIMMVAYDYHVVDNLYWFNCFPIFFLGFAFEFKLAPTFNNHSFNYCIFFCSTANSGKQFFVNWKTKEQNGMKGRMM